MYITVAPNTTYCPDTPENWDNFHRLKAELLTGGLRKTGGTIEQRLRLQEAKERKWLKEQAKYDRY